MTTPAANRPVVPQPPAPVAALAPADRIREAARTERYWILAPTSDTGWTLRQLDDTTGSLGEVAHRVRELPDLTSAQAWATALLGADGWQPTQVLLGGYIEQAYPTVRSVARYPRPGRTLVLRVETHGPQPGHSAAVLRERWGATGNDSDPIAISEPSLPESDILTWASRSYGLDRARWQTGPGGEHLLQ
ncbi:hypothetical protein OHQ88_34265 (plasmid) [Micromonospora zamorensis]|uniref:hypothetical protein n=1 Tax=Micromonospora zamorensis TaxID=709883 RepID=UPI002E1F3AD6